MIYIYIGMAIGTPHKSSSTPKSITNVNKVSPKNNKRSVTKNYVGVLEESFKALIAIPYTYTYICVGVNNTR